MIIVPMGTMVVAGSLSAKGPTSSEAIGYHFHMLRFGLGRLIPSGVSQSGDRYTIRARWKRLETFLFEHRSTVLNPSGKVETTSVTPWSLMVRSVDSGIANIVVTGGPTNVNGRTETANKEIFTFKLDSRLDTMGTGNMPIGGDFAPILPEAAVQVGDTWSETLTVPTSSLPLPAEQIFTFDGPGNVNGQNIVAISSRVTGAVSGESYAAIEAHCVTYINVKDGMIEKAVQEVKLRTSIEGARNAAWHKASSVYRRLR